MTPTTFGIIAALCLGAPPSPSGRVAIARTEEAVHFYAEGELVASYHYGTDMAKPYFWPLNASGGIPLTQPVGEKQSPSSAWFGHGDVIPEGIEFRPRRKDIKGIDFWSGQPGHGIITCENVSVIEGVAGRAEARTKNVWKTTAGQAILDEDRQIELFNLGTSRLLVVTSTLKPAAITVGFADTNLGGFAIQAADSLRGPGKPTVARSRPPICNSVGNVGEIECSGCQACWCDFSGLVNGEAAGIAIFEDPANRAKACWNVRNNGLMTANPFWHGQSGSGKSNIRLKPGEQLTLRYALLLHSGDAATGDVAGAYRKFLALLQ
ncbi:MAG: DUF6807 family protein [Gemmataceae bacterium]